MKSTAGIREESSFQPRFWGGSLSECGFIGIFTFISNTHATSAPAEALTVFLQFLCVCVCVCVCVDIVPGWWAGASEAGVSLKPACCGDPGHHQESHRENMAASVCVHCRVYRATETQTTGRTTSHHFLCVCRRLPAERRLFGWLLSRW